ncbi:MAG: hypothetical protein HZC41_12560 [Chloroflexi bacterium]|nr:hypothetical protein [Chloroflexota bacterium]
MARWTVGLRRVLRWLRRALAWALLIGLMLALLQYSTVPLGLDWYAVATLAQDEQFDYVTWELNAIGVKIHQTLYGLHPFMSETDRTQRVRDYMADLQQAQALEAQINAIYSDPNQPNPDAASADLRAQLRRLRADLDDRQALVEAILEGQVAAVLAEQGFAVAGQILPPVSAHFTRVPNLLVVSPRDQIRFDISINLDPMTADEITTLEATIDHKRKVSSLVVPLGGIAMYPTMVLETASIPWALDTISHEWLHNYLFAFPLGLSYFSGESFVGETRVINETTANLFGREMSRLVLARYYPDLLPPESRGEQPSVPAEPAEPPAFDFGREMDITRRTVDRLLGAGQVDKAEAYMEERRQVFVANGYSIRKLNQAYFAFYGGYQSGEPGAGGEDPVGPAIQAIRDASPSLHAWIVTMRGITSREQLLAVENQLEGASWVGIAYPGKLSATC